MTAASFAFTGGNFLPEAKQQNHILTSENFITNEFKSCLDIVILMKY